MEGSTSYTKLGFASIEESQKNIPVPPRQLNGGRYTGEPYAPGAGWANVPITPESDVHLKDAFARNHIPGGNRAGNNKTNTPNHRVCDPMYPYLYTSDS